MSNRFLEMPRVLNKPEFWIWHDCICKGYAELEICLIMAPYTSIMLEYASICLNVLHLNMTEYCLKSVSIPKNSWINCSHPARVLNTPRYSYNNIIFIIVTNIIVLEFLSAQFVHPGALLLFYLFLTWVRT